MSQFAKRDIKPVNLIEEDIYQSSVNPKSTELAVVKISYETLPTDVQAAILDIRKRWRITKIFEVQPSKKYNDVSYLLYLNNQLEQIKVYFNKTGDVINTTNLCSTSYTLAP